MTFQFIVDATIIVLCLAVGVAAVSVFGTALVMEFKEWWHNHHWGGHHHMLPH